MCNTCKGEVTWNTKQRTKGGFPLVKHKDIICDLRTNLLIELDFSLCYYCCEYIINFVMSLSLSPTCLQLVLCGLFQSSFTCSNLCSFFSSNSIQLLNHLLIRSHIHPLISLFPLSFILSFDPLTHSSPRLNDPLNPSSAILHNLLHTYIYSHLGTNLFNWLTRISH